MFSHYAIIRDYFYYDKNLFYTKASEVETVKRLIYTFEDTCVFYHVCKINLSCVQETMSMPLVRKLHATMQRETMAHSGLYH